MSADHDPEILERLDAALLDPVWGSSNWLMCFQAFMEIEVKPEIERLRAELDACICRRGEAIELTGGHQHSTPIQIWTPDEQ